MVFLVSPEHTVSYYQASIYIKPVDLGYFATIRNDVSQKQVMYY